jgi:hypothetical protein
MNFEHILTSRKFEKSSYYLRKIFNRLSIKFNHLNKVNFPSLINSPYYDHNNQATAQDSLNTIKQVLNESFISEYKKTIWFYWNSPIESAPLVVQMSYKTWVEKNPDFDVILLSDKNLPEVIGFDFMTVFFNASVNLNTAIKSDILRLYLLIKYGGIWVDATTFCIKPLSKWLKNEIKHSQFFIFRNNNSPIRPAEVWFIYSSQGHPVVKATLERMLSHIFKPRKTTLYISNSQLKKITDINSNQPLGEEVVYRAESLGFMPYFSTGFFLYQSLLQKANSDTNSYWGKLELTTNNHVTNNDDFESFKMAFVSKQTYKKDYQDSLIFKERCQYLNLI